MRLEGTTRVFQNSCKLASSSFSSSSSNFWGYIRVLVRIIRGESEEASLRMQTASEGGREGGFDRVWHPSTVLLEAL